MLSPLIDVSKVLFHQYNGVNCENNENGHKLIIIYPLPCDVYHENNDEVCIILNVYESREGL